MTKCRGHVAHQPVQGDFAMLGCGWAAAYMSVSAVSIAVLAH